MTQSSLLKLLQGVLVAFFLYLVLLGVLNLVFISSIDASSEQASRAYETHRQLTRLRNVVLLTESGQRGFLLTKDGGYVITVTDQRNEAKKLLEEMDRFVMRESLRTLVSELQPRVEAKLDELERTIELQKENKTQEAIALVMTNTGKELTEEINDRINTLQEAELEAVAEHNATTNKLVVGLRWMIGLGLASFGIFAATAYRRIAHRFQPLHALADRAHQFSQGDLFGGSMPILTQDEIGIVTEAFNSMLVGLKRIFSRTEETQAKIVEVSARLARSSAEQASSSVQQATGVQETVVTLEKLSQSATQIAERASEAGGQSRVTAGESCRGLEAVQETMRLSEKARQGVEDVASTIVALSQKAQDLEVIVNSVNELAERSNILSINASIQAAAAGAEGVTFSVLANEMRLLANRSKEATVEVKGSLQEIRNGIHKAVMMAEEAVKRWQAGDETQRRTEQTIATMVESFKKGDDAFQQIVAATRQQSHAFKQVEEALASIQVTATQAEKRSQELERDSQELISLSQELHKTTSRLDGGRETP